MIRNNDENAFLGSSGITLSHHRVAPPSMTSQKILVSYQMCIERMCCVHTRKALFYGTIVLQIAPTASDPSPYHVGVHSLESKSHILASVCIVRALCRLNLIGY